MPVEQRARDRAISRPGKTLAKTTRPANGADPYRSSVKSTSATPTIDCAMRAICIESSTRPRFGTRSSSR